MLFHDETGSFAGAKPHYPKPWRGMLGVGCVVSRGRAEARARCAGRGAVGSAPRRRQSADDPSHRTPLRRDADALVAVREAARVFAAPTMMGDIPSMQGVVRQAAATARAASSMEPVTLVASDGSEIIIDKKAAMVSGTIKSMLAGPGAPAGTARGPAPHTVLHLVATPQGRPGVREPHACPCALRNRRRVSGVAAECHQVPRDLRARAGEGCAVLLL